MSDGATPSRPRRAHAGEAANDGLSYLDGIAAAKARSVVKGRPTLASGRAVGGAAP